jgi:hypothetical protein
MVTAEITLKAIWGFLGPVFSDKLRDALKKRDSSDIAKKRTYKLYKGLGDVKVRTFDFITSLRLYASLLEQQASPAQFQESKDSLYDRTDELMAATADMMDALDELSPQLEIHDYPLYHTIAYFKGGREAYGITDAWSGEEFQVALEDAEAGNPDQLDAIVAQEEQNYRLIDQCLADFRVFIRKELPYKEGF